MMPEEKNNGPRIWHDPISDDYWIEKQGKGFRGLALLLWIGAGTLVWLVTVGMIWWLA